MKSVTFTVKTEKRAYPDGFVDSPVYRYLILDRTAEILAEGETNLNSFTVNIPEGLGHVLRVQRNGVIFDQHFDVTPDSQTYILFD